MGSNWVINMGVPALIGVCQQSASGGGASSYSYSGLTSTTLSYGNQVGSGSSPIVSVPGGEQLTTTLNAGNTYAYGGDPPTGAIFYSGSNEDRRINLDIGFVADVTSLNPADLPTDGNCAITYTITPTIAFFEIRDFITGEAIGGEGVATDITITGLNRNQISDGATLLFSLPTIANDSKGIRCLAGEDAPLGRGYDVDVTILMGDGSQLAPTNQGDARVVYGSGDPPSFIENLT